MGGVTYSVLTAFLRRVHPGVQAPCLRTQHWAKGPGVDAPVAVHEQAARLLVWQGSTIALGEGSPGVDDSVAVREQAARLLVWQGSTIAIFDADRGAE